MDVIYGVGPNPIDNVHIQNSQFYLPYIQNLAESFFFVLCDKICQVENSLDWKYDWSNIEELGKRLS